MLFARRAFSIRSSRVARFTREIGILRRRTGAGYGRCRRPFSHRLTRTDRYAPAVAIPILRKNIVRRRLRKVVI